MVAPRRLTLQQQAAIASALARFAGKRVVLGQQVIAALQGARIGVDDRRMSDQTLGLIATGVYVTGSDTAFVTALFQALSSLGGIVAAIQEVPRGAGMGLSDDGTVVDATVF